MYSLYKNPSGEIKLDLTALTKAMTADDLNVRPTAAGDINQDSPPLSELQLLKYASGEAVADADTSAS